MSISLLESTPRWGWSSLPKHIREPNPEIYLKSNNYVVLDFETTNVDYGDAGIDANRIILAVWLDSRRVDRVSSGIQVCRAGEDGQNELRTRIESADFVVCHNSKFELKWLHRMGVNLREILPYCTQIGEYVLAGNRGWELGLDATAGRYGLSGKLGFAGGLIKAGYPVEDIPERDLEEYCIKDVELTHEIFLNQRKRLGSRGLLKTAYARNIVTPALADIEYKGTRLNGERVFAEFARVQPEFKAVSERFATITDGVNFSSPKQVRSYLYDKLNFEEPRDWRGNPIRTKTGLPSTKKENLERLVPKTPKQKEFKQILLDIAPLKRNMQILEQMVQCCKEDEGKVYATFHQTVTATHRLSSTGGKWGFQFHNFPREFKPLFRARRDGWLLSEADAPSLEFRVAIDLGNDERGKADLRAGVDVHKLSATTIGVDRQNAKKYTFRPLYGGDSGTPRERAYYKAFREQYSQLYETQVGWTYEVLGNKELTIPSGLTFYWPDTTIDRRGYIKNRTNIFNYPIQSFATADIIPLIVVLVWHYIKDLEVKIVNTVHDSIIAELLEKDSAVYKEILKQAFTKDIKDLIFKLYCYKLDIPLGVGIKVGEHWSEGDEEKYEETVDSLGRS